MLIFITQLSKENNSEIYLQVITCKKQWLIMHPWQRKQFHHKTNLLHWTWIPQTWLISQEFTKIDGSIDENENQIPIITINWLMLHFIEAFIGMTFGTP